MKRALWFKATKNIHSRLKVRNVSLFFKVFFDTIGRYDFYLKKKKQIQICLREEMQKANLTL